MTVVDHYVDMGVGEWIVPRYNFYLPLYPINRPVCLSLYYEAVNLGMSCFDKMTAHKQWCLRHSRMPICPC